MNTIKTEISELIPWMIAFRRYLHAHPELSFEEYETTEKIINELNKLEHIQILKPFKTGCAAILKGPYDGKTLLLRADIDALPIQEENDLEFISLNNKVMHACGHDGHTAMMLAACKYFDKHYEEIYGKVIFLFQHAEELPPGGAIEWANYGICDGVDELYGLHLSSNYPTGKFGIRVGALTSATDRFDIEIIGKGGHSAFPETTLDPMITAGEIITSLQTIVSRKIKAVEPIVVSICQINGGDAYNIIPERIHLTGSTRTFNPETRKNLPLMMEKIIKGICDSNDMNYEFSFTLGYASVINDKDITLRSKEIIENTFGKEATFDIEPLMPGEDYSALQGKCDAFFVELGARNEEKGIIYPHHNSHYLLDEKALAYGLIYWIELINNRLGA